MLDEGQRSELVGKGLRRTYDAAGLILREKPPRSVRMLARLARKRARLGLEALARSDLFEAGSLFGWANAALAIASERRTYVQLEPAARSGRRVSVGGAKGHEMSYGTPAVKAARWKTYARDYQEARADGSGKGAAARTVAKQHGCNPRTVVRAVERILGRMV